MQSPAIQESACWAFQDRSLHTQRNSFSHFSEVLVSSLLQCDHLTRKFRSPWYLLANKLCSIFFSLQEMKFGVSRIKLLVLLHVLEAVDKVTQQLITQIHSVLLQLPFRLGWGRTGTILLPDIRPDWFPGWTQWNKGLREGEGALCLFALIQVLAPPSTHSGKLLRLFLTCYNLSHI